MLTGRFDFKLGFGGKLILLVEDEVQRWGKASGVTRKVWRKAKAIDLAAPALRPLIDLKTGRRAAFTPSIVPTGGAADAPTPFTPTLKGPARA